VSIGRSGDSPESTAVVERTLVAAPDYRHLVITCNARGGLATRYADEPRVRCVVLDPATNDRSLVMTSSFTNLLLAGSGLAVTDDAEAVAELGQRIFERHGDALAAVAARALDSAVYLGSGPAVGAAHEAALKMLEMSGGMVSALAESFLGLRHGPMSWLAHRPGLVVAFLSGDATARAYEHDLLDELGRKQLGACRVVVGESVPAAMVGAQGVAVELPGFDALNAVQQTMLHVLVGQLLAFFRCVALGHRPDTPSEGVLTRVVGRFALHGPEGEA
jgi:tagatose-6-phosphate ketose/aldose isomerase